MRDARVVRGFVRRGCIWLFHRVEFPDTCKAKYGLVLEDCPETLSATTTETIIVAFTTSNMRYLGRAWTVLIPDGAIADLSGDSLVDLNNCHEVPVDLFESGKCKYIGQVSDGLLGQINSALLYATRVPPSFMVRIRPR